MQSSPRSIRRIAINTGGGDAPGLNAVIRAATLAALNNGWEVLGIRRGYTGLLEGEVDGEPGLVPLTAQAVRGITHLGGTILGTTTRGNPFGLEVRKPDGTWGREDRSGEIVDRFRELEIDALVAIGGDGSLNIANALYQKGLPVIGVPKTIDNDLQATDVTFGFQTAVEVATDAIGRLHSTAEAHQRVMVVELMGRHMGWIALESGIAGGADVILIPEIAYDAERIARKVRERDEAGRRFSIIVVAEGAHPAGGEPSFADGSGRYGGIAERLGNQIQERTGKETRTLVLGHIQRGGSPDRLRPQPRPALRRGRRALHPRGKPRNDGRAEGERHPPRPAAGGGARAQTGAAGQRHRPHGAPARDLLRRLRRPAGGSTIRSAVRPD